MHRHAGNADSADGAGDSAASSLAWARVVRAPRIAATWLFGYDAFVSHAHRDGAPYAHELFVWLERSRYTVCLDSADFSLGDELDTSLALVKRSRLLVLLDTPAARESIWVRREIEFAIDRRLPIARICLGTNESIERTGEPTHDWPLLTDTQVAQLNSAISCREPSTAGVVDAVSTTVLSALVRGLGRYTALRRLRTAMLAVVMIATGLAGAYALKQVSELQLQAALWRAEDPERSLDTVVTEATDFLSGPWAPVAEWFHPDAFDEAVQEMLRLTTLRAVRSDPQNVVATSTDGRVALLSNRDQGYGLRGSQNDNCRIPMKGIRRAVVSNTGRYVVTAHSDDVRVWRVRDCVPVRLPLNATADHPDPAQAPQDGNAGVPLLALNDTGTVAAVAWHRAFFRVALDGTEPVVTDRWTPPPSSAEVTTDIVRLRLSATGNVAVVALGPEAQPTAFCLVRAGTAAAAACEDLDTLADVTIDPSERFVITSDQQPFITVWPVATLHAADRDSLPNVPLFRRQAAASRLAVASTGAALLSLQNADDDSYVVTAFDLPTLVPLARTPVADRRRTTVSGRVRYRRGVEAVPSEGNATERLPQPVQPCESALRQVQSSPLARPAAIDYSRARLLDATADCSRLVVGSEDANPAVVEVFRAPSRQPSSADSGVYRLEHRRQVYGTLNSVRLHSDPRGDWLRVFSTFDEAWLDVERPAPQFVLEIPLSRRAVLSTFAESSHDSVDWSMSAGGERLIADADVGDAIRTR